MERKGKKANVFGRVGDDGMPEVKVVMVCTGLVFLEYWVRSLLRI